jgi:hypothetical protein
MNADGPQMGRRSDAPQMTQMNADKIDVSQEMTF